MPIHNDSLAPRTLPAGTGETTGTETTRTTEERRTTPGGLELATDAAHLGSIAVPDAIDLRPRVGGRSPPGTRSPDGGPPAPDALRAGIPMLARHDFGGRAIGDRAGAFELIPGRYPDAIGLDAVLGQLANDPRFAGTVRAIVAGFEARTGVKVPHALLNAAIANPARLADILAVTPAQLSQGFDAMLAAFHGGAIQDAAPKAAALGKVFDLAKLADPPVKLPEYKLKELAPGLFQGDVRSALPDAQAKVNIATAEIFDRLAENASKPAAERFAVRYDGGVYTRLETFLAKLVENGHEIDVSFNHRIANFADLKTKAPDGRILDVPAALLIRTGVQHDGAEAVLPAAHAEMVIRVRSTERTRGTKVDAGVKFYQGMNATGFFACDVAHMPSWCGHAEGDKLQGKQALEAIELSGLLSDVINSVAREQNLPFGAYGLTGVCMDSVEVVRFALTGQLGYWPLLMRDRLLLPAIEARLADHDRRDDPEYRALRKAMAAVPSDMAPDGTARARMLNSIPWPEGQEPFQSIVEARKILKEAP